MKFKAKTKDCKLIIRAKTSFGERIDKKELNSFEKISFLRVFLKPTKTKKRIINYEGPKGISLYERMKKPITKRDFLFIMEYIVVAVQKLQKNNLSLGNLEKNIKNVYINEQTKEIRFIYLPTVKTRNTGDLITLIDSVIYSANSTDEKVKDFVSEFAFYFHSLKPLDVNKIEAFIRKKDRDVVNTIQKQNIGGSGSIPNRPEYYADYEDEKTDLIVTGKIGEDEKTGLLDEDEPTGQIAEDEATGFLNESEEQTSQFSEQEVCYATLYRVLTNEKIKINKPVFRLGKERSYVDYFVTNNPAVSRSHVDIITRAAKHYVLDMNSKNHTYINGRQIPARVETEIFNGDKLTLGNEEFVFEK